MIQTYIRMDLVYVNDMNHKNAKFSEKRGIDPKRM